MHKDIEQFGVPAENIKAAQKWAKKHRRKQEYHTHVPTRKEIRTLPPAQLSTAILGWLLYSPIEIVPSRHQVELVIEILQTRHDVSSLDKILAMCRNYVSGQ